MVNLFHFEDRFIDEVSDALKEPEPVTLIILRWDIGHYGYANIIMAVFIGLGLKSVFGKSGFNFFKIIIPLCFVMGIGAIIICFTVGVANYSE